MLIHGVFPPGLNAEERAVFAHKVRAYTLVKGTLFKQGPDQKLRRCLEDVEIPLVIEALHDGVTGGTLCCQDNGPEDPGCWLLVADFT